MTSFLFSLRGMEEKSRGVKKDFKQKKIKKYLAPAAPLDSLSCSV